MLSFLFGKKNKTTTTIDAAVQDTLRPASHFPEPPPAHVLAGVSLRQVAVDFTTKPLTIVDRAERNRTTTGYVIERPGQPRLMVVGTDDPVRVELWELGDGELPALVRQRPMVLDPDQDRWATSVVHDVAVLSPSKILLAVGYISPFAKDGLWVFDLDKNAASVIEARAACHPRQLDQLFETRVVSDDSVLVLYYSGRTRKRAEVYYNLYNHFLLYSPRHPSGKEVLKLGAQDGSTQRWEVVDRTLWIDAVDAQSDDHPKQSVWSLNLSKVL